MQLTEFQSFRMFTGSPFSPVSGFDRLPHLLISGILLISTEALKNWKAFPNTLKDSAPFGYIYPEAQDQETCKFFSAIEQF